MRDTSVTDDPAGDRLWFEFNPSAWIRHRPASDTEFRQLFDVGLIDALPAPPPGYRLEFMIEVRQVVRGFRLRIPYAVITPVGEAA